MNDPDFPLIIKKILIDLSDYFKLNKIPYVIVGGIVVNIWGRSRNTNDVDIVVDHQELNIQDFVTYLNSHDYDITTYEMETGFKEKSNITIYYKSFRIDLVGLHRASQRTQLKNAITMNIYNNELKIDSPEALIANKLSFGSLVDFEDALSVYIRKDINNEKLSQICQELHVERYLSLLDRMKNNKLSIEELDGLLDKLNDSL